MKAKGIVVTTLGTYPISSVKRLFLNGQPTRDGVRKIYEVMISTSQFETLELTMKRSQLEICNNLFCLKVLFSTDPYTLL